MNTESSKLKHLIHEHSRLIKAEKYDFADVIFCEIQKIQQNSETTNKKLTYIESKEKQNG